MNPKIFISYRRNDSAFETTAIYRELADRFGRENVFMDVDAIPAGRDFRTVIDQKLRKCDVQLVIIGENWLTAKDEAGELRLQKPTDYVRLEIEAALERNIAVIPCIVGNMTLPNADELPESLTQLAYRHGTTIRPGRDFHRDIEALLEDIARTVDREAGANADAPVAVELSTPTKWRPGVRYALIIAACVVVASIAIWYSLGNSDDAETQSSSERTLSAGLWQESADDGEVRETPKRTVAYRFSREDDVVRIFPVLSYLEELEAGEELAGVPGGEFPLDAKWPRVSLKAQNQTDHAIMLSEVVISVRASRKTLKPIPMVSDGALNSLIFFNEGWQKLIDPQLSVSLSPTASTSGSQLFQGPRVERKLPDIADIYRVNLRDELAAFKNSKTIQATGHLEYGPSEARKRFVFSTGLVRGQETGAGVKPSATYDVFLPAGKAPYSERKSIAHVIAPGEADQILFTIASDASAAFDLVLDVYDNENKLFGSVAVEVELLVPRHSKSLQDSPPDTVDQNAN